MTDDPFRTLVVEALNLTHPRFAAADAPGSFLREFYHQVRHLWDRAVPVQLGLGHVVVQADPDAPPGPGGGTNIVSRELVPKDWNVNSKQEATVTKEGPNQFDFDIP